MAPFAEDKTEVPAPEQYISVTFSSNMEMRLTTSADLTTAHLWAASGYLNQVANQFASDVHMAELAQAARESQAKRPTLLVPRDHLPPRRPS